jgi:hypothetical protein
MARIDPHRRPQYPPTERMAILELRAARNWSLEQTADVFLVTAPTMGKVKIAQTLARASFHLGPTTVGRMLKEGPAPQPITEAQSADRVITSRLVGLPD